MAAIKGPAVLLAQFLRDVSPFNTLGTSANGSPISAMLVCRFSAGIDASLISTMPRPRTPLATRKLAGFGLSITEVAAYLVGQVFPIHPAYEAGLCRFSSIRPAGNGTDRAGLARHLIDPWPQRPPGLIDEVFKELARRWRPLLGYARDRGCLLGFELYPGSDVHDGATFEMFLDHTDDHPAACINYDASHFLLQQLDYCAFIEQYGERISRFHVKDAEFRLSGRGRVYGGYQPWNNRAGRFRSLGDGQVDFKRIFTL
jgi:sugar phosphate isomerase/epimerase